MFHCRYGILVSIALLVGGLCSSPAGAQFYTTYYCPPPVAVVSYYTPVVAPAITTYYTPVYSYSLVPAPVYSVPVTTYYTPPAAVTTTYVRPGLFRTRVYSTTTYYPPVYYSPLYLRY